VPVIFPSIFLSGLELFFGIKKASNSKLPDTVFPFLFKVTLPVI